MKKILLVLVTFFTGSILANTLNHKGKKFEVYTGPSMEARSTGVGNQIDFGAKFGGDTFSGALDFSLGEINTLKPKFVFDMMYYYKNNELIMGPTFDLGPSINFNLNNFFFNFFEIGAGYRVMYEVTNTMGVVLTPVHITTSFFGWDNNRGVEADLWVSYEMFFSLYYLL